MVDADASVVPGGVVDDLNEHVPSRPRDDQARTGGGAGDLLADPECDGACAPTDLLGARAELGDDGHGLLARLSGLAADDLAGVAHALALVRVGLAELADVGGDLADLLLVDARRPMNFVGLSTAKVMPSGASTRPGG